MKKAKFKEIWTLEEPLVYSRLFSPEVPVPKQSLVYSLFSPEVSATNLWCLGHGCQSPGQSRF